MLPALWNEGALDRLFAAPFFGETRTFVPGCDIDETETGYEITLDLPGVSKDDLKVNVEGQTLTVSGSRTSSEAKEGLYSRRSRWTGEFTRTFNLGDGCDGSRITASLKDGVLKLGVAKAESAKPREIAIG